MPKAVVATSAVPPAAPVPVKLVTESFGLFKNTPRSLKTDPRSSGSSASTAVRTFTGPTPNADDANTPGWRRADIGAANGHGNEPAGLDAGPGAGSRAPGRAGRR